MIDFTNSVVFKLSHISPEQVDANVYRFLIHNETVIMAFRAIRDQVVFTNMRIIAINIQGLTGKKVDYTSIPYSKIQAFSVETAGTFDLDSEVDIIVSSLGRVRFEFKARFDIIPLTQMISSYVLR